MNPVALRILNQHLAVPQFSTPKEVVSHFGAMQAQEYRMMRWAVSMRTKKPSASQFRELFDRGEIIRLHLMRGTWQLVSAEDYWWMLSLCAPKAIAVTKGWMHSNHITIPARELSRIRKILVRTAEEKGSVTKEDFVLALTENDVVMDEHRLSYHIRMAEFDGILCSGNLLPMKATYALSTKKVGSPVKTDRDEALMRLALKYFQSHQPATLEDFVWWSGLNVGDCRRAVQILGDDVNVERHGERDFIMLSSCRRRGFRRNQFLLLAPYDEYLIGYKSRDISLSEEYRHRAHSNNGIFHPVVLHDGIVCGNWKPFSKSHEATFFEGGNDVEINKLFKQYDAFCKQ